MNILIIGSGGREHTLAWKLTQSPLLKQLYIAPGNAGTQAHGENVSLDVGDFSLVSSFCLEKEIDMLVVGPEAPLVNGIANHFAHTSSLKKIKVIGPQKAGAMLEGSKDFSKQFMLRHGIPTAASKTFTVETLEEAKNYLSSRKPPFVLKADGLAAGKGVIITKELSEARQAIESMLGGRFGKASSQVLVEDFMEGIELSVFILTDGKDYVLMPSAKDYKRVGEGNTGLNTGGMGAISPVPFANDAFMEKVEKQVVQPTLKGLREEGIPYTGFLYFGLMNRGGEPYVVEYNVRMGDPETQVVMPRLESDLLELFLLATEGKLNEAKTSFDPQTTTTVVLVSGGYPGSYEKGKVIEGFSQLSDEVTVFHAGTELKSEKTLTNGGRVLAVTAKGGTMQEALSKSNEAANLLQFEGKYYRKDIGFDL